eukprot:TRINITY_DN329_c0_g1_i1.p1 TRINITY_DN329_c0_g1~~TRINITY_DN329_c0_g1_i1.p1  ORF type:complete len:245 (-),score=64.67 TRINITY_DN329_c0_g1_i1:135-869(-)
MSSARAFTFFALVVAICLVQGHDEKASYKSELSCTHDKLVHLGTTFDCVIRVLTLDGKEASATTNDFMIASDNGDVAWTSPEDTPSSSLTFTYSAPTRDVDVLDAIRVDFQSQHQHGKGHRNVINSPWWFGLTGTPSTNSYVTCNFGNGKTTVKYGNAIKCRITIVDSKGIVTSGFGQDLWVYMTNANGQVIQMQMTKVSKAREQFDFSYKPVSADGSQLTLFAGIRKSGKPMKNSGMTFTLSK